MQRRLTNNILFTQTASKIELIIPTYIQLFLHQVLHLTTSRTDYPMMSLLKLSLYIHLLPDTLVSTITNQMEISFNSKEHIKLSKSKYIVKEMDTNNILTFIYDARVPMTLREDRNLMTPFDLKKLETVVTLRSLETVYRGKKVWIRFNFMDTERIEDKFRIGKEIRTFGEYGIANAETKVEFSSTVGFEKKKERRERETDRGIGGETERGMNRKNEKQRGQVEDKDKNKIKKLQYWQYAKYTLVLYRYPGFVCLELFLPLYILALANIVGFMYHGTLSEKNSIATLILTGYLILITTNSSKNYNSSSLNLISINRLLMFFILLLFLINSLANKNYLEEQHSGSEYLSSVCFILSVGVLGGSIISVLLLLYVHKVWWEPKYRPDVVGDSTSVFESERWSNEECDEYYMGLRLDFQEISKLR